MFEEAHKKVNKFYPNKVVNWEKKVNSRMLLMHITNRDDNKNYILQLFPTGGFIDYKEVEDNNA